MNEKNKESRFLDAINKDAEAHKAQITQEIEEYKSDKLEQATKQGLQDAYDLIRANIASRKAEIVNDLARRELELRNGLYAERGAIRDEVFDLARERLSAFVRGEEYAQFLERSLREIAEATGTEKCVVYIAPFDEGMKDLIKDRLADCEIKVDNHIIIGGIRADCPSRGIMLDDTLDTRLNDCYAWFNENSGLKVV